jgi:SAM-dependent methyltransferase
VPQLAYQTLERLRVSRPVERVSFIAERCRGKRVLDIGCLDETALDKQNTTEWLHRRIGALATQVTGVDLSEHLPAEGLVTGPNSRIIKGDGTNPDVAPEIVDIIVAGEFIEHIENPLQFLSRMARSYPGREMIISTPNGVSFANALLGTIGREAQHRDHLLTSTYKTLNTLCQRAGCRDWDIIPYRFYATEMLLESTGPKRIAVKTVEAIIRAYESIFPLRSFGYVVRITL